MFEKTKICGAHNGYTWFGHRCGNSTCLSYAILDVLVDIRGT